MKWPDFWMLNEVTWLSFTCHSTLDKIHKSFDIRQHSNVIRHRTTFAHHFTLGNIYTSFDTGQHSHVSLIRHQAIFIPQFLLHMVFTSRNWFVMQGPLAIILISWNVIFIWETLLRHTLIEQYFWHFCWLPYLYIFSLCENPSIIIFSAETEYITTRSWYRNINFVRDRIRRIFS
jgi:hypothetical protein